MENLFEGATFASFPAKSRFKCREKPKQIHSHTLVTNWRRLAYRR